MKKVLLGAVLALGIAVTPLAVTKADPIPDVPGCVFYNSTAQPVPFTLHCDDYDYNGTYIYHSFDVNSGT